MGEWGYITSVSTSSYADANSGTGTASVNATVNSYASPTFVGEVFDVGSGTYAAVITYLCFDMSALPGDVTNVYLQSDWSQLYNAIPIDHSFNINIAVHDYGATLDVADWLNAAALTALTPIATIPTTAFPTTSKQLITELPLGSMNVGGTTRLVIYTDVQAAASAPSANLSVSPTNLQLVVKRSYVDPGTGTDYRSEVAADTPTVAWRLDELAGTVAADSSGNSHPGTYLNGPTLGVTGLIPNGTAATFSNGADSHVVSVDDLYHPSPFTAGVAFEGLINVPLPSLFAPIVGFEVPEQLDVNVFPADNETTLFFVSIVDATNPTQPGPQFLVLQPATTYHIIGQYDGTSQLVIYVNGDAFWMVAPGDLLTYGVPTMPVDTWNLYAAGTASGTNSINGTLDEIAYYTHALTDLRARKHYKASFVAAGPGAPTITNISPNSGPTAGSTVVTITGTAFVSVSAVRFGATDALSFIVNSPTSITATSPAHTAGMIDIRVVAAAGTSGTAPEDQFTYLASPIVTSVNPPDGNALGGTAVDIHGSQFTGTTAVMFGATGAASFIVSSDTYISAVSPAHAAATIDIRVTTPIGTSAITVADHYTFVDVVPTIRPPVVRWTFLDPTDASTATFEMNPDSGGTPSREKNIVVQNTLGPNEKTLVVAIADNPEHIDFSGTILTPTMLDLINTWFSKTNPIELTDDLGRTYLIKMLKFDAKRVRKPYDLWFHTYTATAIVIGA